MPSSATITSSQFTDFVPLTRIKSAEVDSNFNIWRGHNIPVDPNTSSAATTRTYDLGSSDYRWNKVHGIPVPYVVSTIGSMSITASHNVCLMGINTSTGLTITANLPTAVGFYGTLIVKNTGAQGKPVLLDGSGTETIDGTTTCELVDYETATLVSDQSNWWRI